MKLRHCCNLTTTPDFSEITNLEELDLEGCVNMVTVHPSIGMLKRLVVLNMRDCRRARSFPSRVEMDSLQVLNLSGCLNVNQLPQAFWSRWWTSISGFIWNQQLPQRSLSLAGLSCLQKLNLEGNNLLEVPESIGGLSCLYNLFLGGNNFTSLPRSLSQLSHHDILYVNGCKKLEVLPELPQSLSCLNAFDCTSLREVSGSSINTFRHVACYFGNCPKLLKNVTIDSEGSISKTRCLDSSITSQGFSHQLSAFLGYAGFQTNRCDFYLQDTGYDELNILYHGNRNIPEWFSNRSTGNNVKVELPSDWCYNKFRGFVTCVVFKCKKHHEFKGCSVKNFDGASLDPKDSLGNPCNYNPTLIEDYFEKEVIRIQDSYMIWLCYIRDISRWNEAKNFVTFCLEENNEEDEDEDFEVKKFGVRLIFYEDLQQEDVTNGSMLQDLPTLSQHGGALSHIGPLGYIAWSW